MVPIGLIKKMYGTAVKVDEINKIVSDNIHKYISEEKLEILGDPLPKQDEQEKIDFETQDDFSFSFELGLAPVFEVGLNKKTKVEQYEIIIDEKMRTGFVENYTRRHGEFIKADTSEEKDILRGHVVKLDEQGNAAGEGPSNDHASISIDVVKDEEFKKELVGKKENDIVEFDIKKAFPNDTEVAGLLNIKKEEAEKTEGRFRFTINEVSRFQPATVDQELFNRIYGEGIVNSEEEFMQKIEEEISASLSRETDYKLLQDLKKLAVDNTNMDLPEEFLKKWLLRVNENTTEELIEKEFDTFRHDLKWQLIRNRIARDNEIKISEEELQKEAENITRYQFSQYGLYYVTDEQVANYARETLKKEDDAKRIADKILEDKVLNQLKEMVSPKLKKVSADDFNKLFE